MNIQDEVASLVSRLERSDPVDLDAGSVDTLEQLLSLVSRLDAGDVEALRAGSPGVAPLYGRYVQWRESEEARALIARGADRGCLERGEGGDYAWRSYARVRDLFERIDFTDCREFVMVGCGPLPVTLLHVAEQTAVPRIIGLDIDESSVRIAREICGRWQPVRVEVCLRNGYDHDFGGADIVYLANLVRPKASVLGHIAEKARPGTRVIVREPFAAGILLAESGYDPRDRRLVTVGCGAGDPRFLSRHLFLERTREQTADVH